MARFSASVRPRWEESQRAPRPATSRALNADDFFRNSRVSGPQCKSVGKPGSVMMVMAGFEFCQHHFQEPSDLERLASLRARVIKLRRLSKMMGPEPD